jgi:hypothetical protein
VTGRNGGRARIAHPLTVRSQIHADLCTDLAGHVGKQTSGLCRPVLFGAQNATICASKLVITEELPATHIGGSARASLDEGQLHGVSQSILPAGSLPAHVLAW